MQLRFSVWKTTVLGGVIFLLPFAAVVYLLGHVVKIIYSVAARLETSLPQWSFGGVSIAMVLATLVLVVLCYAAGLAAQRSFAKRFSDRIERNILLLFPRYAVWKNHLAANAGAQTGNQLQFRPVLVELDDFARIGFEIERSPDAVGARPGSESAVAAVASTGPSRDDAHPESSALVSVYLPGSPDPWNGYVVHVRSERVRPLPVNFTEAAALCETMGRGSARLCAAAADRSGS